MSPRGGRHLNPSLPPVTVLAAGFAAGATATLQGAPLFLAPILLATLLLPNPPSDSPVAARKRWLVRRGLMVAVAAGGLAASVQHLGERRDCRLAVGDGEELSVEGVVEAEPRFSRVRISVSTGLPGGCRASIPVRLPRSVEGPLPGAWLRATGPWRATVGPAREWAGPGELQAVHTMIEERSQRGLLHWRVRVEQRVRVLFPGHAAVVSALVLAKRDGLDPEVRDSFTRAGTAHLLAISGFHVGVVASFILVLLRSLRVGRRSSYGLASVVVWAYVLFIGAPDAAVRAALLLTMLALGRLSGRPLHGLGGLSTAFLLLVAIDPRALTRPGFQLSFAGAAGLALGVKPLERALRRIPVLERSSTARSALATGVAATLATLPIVVWHFGQVSVVGIPATVAATPLLAVAIPGILVAGAVHALDPAIGAFLAGGVELVLDLLLWLIRTLGGLSWATISLERPELLAVLGGGFATRLAVSKGVVARRFRIGALALGGIGGLLVLPVVRGVAHPGTLEIRFIDVGQGDAVAVRSPKGRWLLVDAGPEAGDADRSALVRELRRAGANRLALMVLTHPDLDHIGGAPAVLEGLEVAAVADPGLARGTGPYLAALEAAASEPAPWVVLRRGDLLEIDGLQLEVLHPGPLEPGEADPNRNSLVMLLRYGLFSALLTGDAPADVEEEVAARTGRVDLLKVAHHGSRTSSSDAALQALGPALSVVPVGRRNRYGHPHPEVWSRLVARSGAVLRTDRHGTVRIVARPDGSWSVHTQVETADSRAGSTGPAVR